jgi:hypothetical protein
VHVTSRSQKKRKKLCGRVHDEAKKEEKDCVITFWLSELSLIQ